MLEAAVDLATVINVGAGHLEAVALQTADSVTIEDSRNETSEPDAWTKQFGKRTKVESEQAVQSTMWVSDPWNVAHRILFEKGRVAIVFSHVHKDDAAA